LTGLIFKLDSNGKKSAGSANRPITINTVSMELGLRFTSEVLKKIGGLVAMRYWQNHGKAPAKHE
jgi:hypothetical protein